MSTVFDDALTVCESFDVPEMAGGSRKACGEHPMSSFRVLLASLDQAPKPYRFTPFQSASPCSIVVLTRSRTPMTLATSVLLRSLRALPMRCNASPLVAAPRSPASPVSNHAAPATRSKPRTTPSRIRRGSGILQEPSSGACQETAAIGRPACCPLAARFRAPSARSAS